MAVLSLCCCVQASHCGGFSCCGVQALEHVSFASCSAWAPGSRAQAPQLWYTGLAAPRHVGSSWITD